MNKLIICFVLSFSSWQLNAQVDYSKDYIPDEREYFSNTQIAQNVGIVYLTQWAYYVSFQSYNIHDHGSFKNWYENPLKPHFDKDSFDYNIYKHSLTGNYYYLWYRSRGYEEERAFVWSFISSLLFEFTIETITEKPSWQDIYQTPVFGTVLGVGSEKASRFFHGLDTWYGSVLGYVLNPFTLIPQQKKLEDPSLSFFPYSDGRTWGGQLAYRF